VLSDEREQTAARELQIANLNTLFMQSVRSLGALLLTAVIYEAV